ncbi:MAG TPA: hypothetical protein VJI70_02235 [Candidatus Paceibacterota bacterium]
MYKFVCWLDENGSRVSHVAVFQFAVVMIMMAFLPYDNPKSMFLLEIVLVGVTIMVAILAVIIYRSWQLVLGLSAVAFVENLLIVPFALVGKSLPADGTVNIDGSAIFFVLLAATVIFANLVMLILRQNHEMDAVFISPPTP